MPERDALDWDSNRSSKFLINNRLQTIVSNPLLLKSRRMIECMGHDMLQDCKTAHVSHDNISNDEIKRRLNKALNALFPILSCCYVIPLVCQQEFQVIPQVLLIFNNEYLLHHVLTPLLGRLNQTLTIDQFLA